MSEFKNILSALNSEGRPLVVDGAMGTMLQAMGLKAGALTETMNTLDPSSVMAVHKAYIEAGADIITTNSFSSNGVKLSPYGMDPREEMQKAVRIAKEVAEDSGKRVFVAADLGPTGKLMPPLGDFQFEDAVNAFKPAVSAAEEAGADFVFFETFSDLYECKAAVIAAREASSLPVAVSLTFDESGRTLTGADAETVAVYLSRLGVDAIGINCGLGPDAMEPIAIQLAKLSGLPVIVNANAGLPKINENGETYFDVASERFQSFAKILGENGIKCIGGCCGTTPEYIQQVRIGVDSCDYKKADSPKKQVAVCSGTRVFTFGGKTAVIGERLNPTGKSKLKEALRNSDMDYLCGEAVAQQGAGADILDVNVGIPEINEAEMLPKAVLAIQKVTDLPLQLDSADPDALEAAARAYNGIPIINSVNGKKENLQKVLPIVKKYGAVCVGLLLDEEGIPDCPKGRLAIAEKIRETAEKDFSFSPDFLFDALTLTVATDEKSGEKTLECVESLSKQGFMTVLGVSNISFGMPNRDAINASFLGAAMSRGLSAAIINPSSENMRLVINDPSPNPDFVFSNEPAEGVQAISNKKEMTLFDAVYSGLSKKAEECASSLLSELKPLEVIENHLVPALNALGEDYEAKKLFLPRLLGGAEAAKAAFKVINQSLSGEKTQKGAKIVIATVKGDIHDIGKNIVATLLSNYGFDVIDLGKDVAPQAIVDAAIANDAKIVGLSALMTTTVPAMAETIKLLKAQCPQVKTMVGGAVLTQDYADTMGADFYGVDAMASVRYALSL